MKRDERDMRSAIVTLLNHILMTTVLVLVYLRDVRKDSIRKMQRWKKRERSCLRKRINCRCSRRDQHRCGRDTIILSLFLIVIVRDRTGTEIKQIVSGKDIETQRRVCQKIKQVGIQISRYNVITVKSGGCYTRKVIFLSL